MQGAVDALHAATIALGISDVAAIRTRAIARTDYRIADGNPANGFVHVVARIRIGRTDDQKTTLGQALLSSVETSLAQAFMTHPLAVTVEIHDITQPTFRRNTIRNSDG